MEENGGRETEKERQTTVDLKFAEKRKAEDGGEGGDDLLLHREHKQTRLTLLRHRLGLDNDTEEKKEDTESCSDSSEPNWEKKREERRREKGSGRQ